MLEWGCTNKIEEVNTGILKFNTITEQYRNSSKFILFKILNLLDAKIIKMEL